MLRFPVVVKTHDGNSPEEREARGSRIHYLVAANGVFHVLAFGSELITRGRIARADSSPDGVAQPIL